MKNRRYMAVDAEGTIDLLRDNLRDRYKDCFSIVQELLQNADDAKARRIHFGVSAGLNVKDPMLRGPALYVVNDGPVKSDDLYSIFRIAAGNKHGDKDKIGKFGLGMKSVFHVCEGFYMFGEGLECQSEFPCFCTPWSEDYHPGWWSEWELEADRVDVEVRNTIAPIVRGWSRWFCVWIPMRTELQLVEDDGELLSPILKMFPTAANCESFAGVEYAERASRMLPLLKNVEHLSFGSSSGGTLRHYEIVTEDGRLTMESCALGGEVKSTGDGTTGFRFHGKAVSHTGEDCFKQLQDCSCWPEKTHKESLRRAVRIVDKTEPHAAVCVLSESAERASITVSPCVFLPLSGVREQKTRYSTPIAGNVSLTIYLHGSMFVDAGRQEFNIGEGAVDTPENETELRKEWNRRLFVGGVLPLLVPEIAQTLETVDVKTAEAIMAGLPKVEYVSRWLPEVCQKWCLVSELTADGYAWHKVPSTDKVFSLPRPRSKVIHRVLCGVLPSGAHVIDAEAGRLVRPGILRTELPEDVCVGVLEYIAGMSDEDSDNEVLRQFAQDCASRLDFGTMPERLQEALIWKVGNRRCSYRKLKDLSEGHHLYCHSEGDLKKIFESAVDWDVAQINEPLAAALKLEVPDFTERFVLDVLQEKPPVSSAELRRPLLDVLLQKRSLHGEYEWFKACRYLAHGELDLFDCDEPLFMPLDGDYAEISKKMVDALTRSKYGARCHLPKVITEILTPANQEALKLPMSRADSLVLAFSALQSFDDVSFADDDWRALVMMVPNMLELSDVKAALKRIPAFPTYGGTLTAIANNVFRANKDFAVPDELARSVKLLRIEGNDRSSTRLERLSVLWNPNDCIRITDAEQLEHSVRARIFKYALTHFNEYISPDVEKTLKTSPWVDLKDGRVVSPEDVLTLGEMSDLVAGCVTIADVSDVEVAELLKKHALSVGTSASVESLFALMAEDAGGKFRIGRFENPDGSNKVIDAYTLSKVMSGDGEKHLPAITILNRLSSRKVSFAAHVDKLRGRISDSQLMSVVQILTSAIDVDADKEQNEKVFSLLYSYLDEAAALGNFIRDIVPHLKFFNRNNTLKKSKDLCFGVEGVPDKYILSDVYIKATGFVAAIKSAVAVHQATGFDKQVSFRDYFASWDQEFADRIGGFIICCSDQPDDVSLAKDRYGFESRSVEEARNGICPDLNSFLHNQHCYILATPDERIDVISISGEKMEVTATPLLSADSLFCGQFNTCEYVRNSVLEMSMGNPPMPREDHSLILRLRRPDPATLADLPQTKLDSLFRNTLDVVLGVYHLQNPAAEQFWESLKHSEQLAVRVTKSIILQSLNTYLPMINCRDDGLKDTFTKWHDLAYSEAEAEQHGNSAQVARYRDQRAGLQKDLEHRISTDISLSEAILKALRAKMQDYQYDIDSMLFELFQNADDATEELHDMYGSDVPALPDRFCVRYDGHNLIVAHWGRPINQTKVGADSGSKYAAFRADLQKMLMLSQSGKGRVDVKVSGKFGLGFKTVFLVCDIPCVISGKLKFKILGGLLPEPLDEEEEDQLRYITSEFTNVEAAVKPTVFVLPLRKDLREKVAIAVAKFTKQIDVLSAFSHRIKDISVVGTDGAEVVARRGVGSGLRLLNVQDAQLLIGEKDGVLEPLDKDVATYWVTAPTEMRAELGVALNADFDLDPGRSYLNLRSEKNAVLLPRIADELYDELVRLYDSLDSEERKRFFERLFEIVAGRDGLENWRDDGSHAAANAMREVLWGRSGGAYLRLLRKRPVIPSGLSGELDAMCLLGEIDQMVCKAIADSELLKLIPKGTLKPGTSVAESKLMKLGGMFFPDEIRSIPLYTVCKLLDDIRESYFSASPEWCAGEGARILLSELTDVDKLDVLRQFEFKTRSGALRAASELVIADQGNDKGRDEVLKASFMPPDYVLSDEYDEQGVAFAKLCRGESRVKDRVFAAQASATSDLDAQVAVLRYLANGSPSEKFKKALLEIRDEGWLSEWMNSQASKQLTRREKDRIADVLSEDEAEYKKIMSEAWSTPIVLPPSDPPDEPCAPISIPAVRDWWRTHAEEELRDYNCEIYDQPEVGKLPLELNSLEDRKAWMQVLVLGAAHALGLRRCQHKGFIVELEGRGYWDKYCKRDLQASEWLDTIDDFLDKEELTGGKYSYWMRLFFRIYQFSKNLDVYVQLFKSWNWAKKCEAPDLATVKNNSTLSGSGIDVPGLEKALPLTGLHFVYREMVRRHAICNPVIYPQCFVPYETVSKVAWNVRNSSEIYRKIVAEIGEQEATFGGAFDIALTQYDKHGREA